MREKKNIPMMPWAHDQGHMWSAEATIQPQKSPFLTSLLVSEKANFCQWIGLREHLQETIDFPSKYGSFL